MKPHWSFKYKINPTTSRRKTEMQFLRNCLPTCWRTSSRCSIEKKDNLQFDNGVFAWSGRNARKKGLEVNLNKTKIMYNSHISPRSIVVNGAALEVVQENVYLGYTIQLDRLFKKENNTWIGLDMVAFEPLRHIFESSTRHPTWLVLKQKYN